MSDIQISGFEILGKLGEGGMASVWKARQLSLDRIVAIKILSPTFASTPEDIEMFQKEAQQAAKLKHLGIVQVYDANAENGNYFFVMEYVAGYTVGTWVERKGALSEQNCLLVAECVADALEYAWNNSNIIHCDIKPDNVMIDDDGTVKVTDLGLARTISAMAEEDDFEDVMGTPQYIAPEQAMGKPDIDFHADIYSLGAMLYHLSTGTMMFEDNPDENVMELQVNSSVPDALDLNPDLSVPFCFLLEKMLAKNPEDRAADWEEIREDISRVKKNQMPASCLAAGAVSSMQRSPNRFEPEEDELELPVDVTDQSTSKFPVVPVLAAALVLVLLVSGVVLIAQKNKRGGQDGGESGGVASTNPSGISQEDSRKKLSAAKEMYDFVIKWISAHPSDYKEGIEKLEAVATQTRGTKYSLMASEKAKALKLSWKAQLTKVMSGLESESQYFINNGEILYAADLYEKYSGPYAADTREMRIGKAQELREKKQREDEFRVQEEKRCAAKYDETLNNIAGTLKGEGLDAALNTLKTCLYDKDLQDNKADLESLNECLLAASRMDERILDTFAEQKGQAVDISLAKGTKKVIVDGVKGQDIMTRQQYGASRVLMSVPIKLSELSVKERLSRMGDDSLPEVALVKGLMALKSGSITYAKNYFAKTHPVIAERLMTGLDDAAADAVSEDAKTDLYKGLVSLGVQVDPGFDEWLWVAAVDKAQMSALAAKKAEIFAKSYQQRYGSTDFGKKAAPILEGLLNKQGAPDAVTVAPVHAGPAGPSRLDAGLDHRVGGEPDGLSEDDVRRAVTASNPEVAWGDIDVFSNSDGNIYKIEIVSQYIQDVSPLAQCKSLVELRCSSVREHHHANERRIAPLEDLTPLSGLPLQKLYVGGTRVQDISCLSNLKLVAIDLHQTKVVDLDPLRNMNLAYINLQDTMVRDISCLGRMDLEHVNLSGTRVFNFSALNRKPIRRLYLNRTQFKDISMCRTMPLEELGIADTKVTSFITLKGMQLASLDVSETQIRDLSVLQGMPLKHLSLRGVRVSDYGVLRNMQLESCNLSGSNIEEIDVVASETLRSLDVSRTDIKNLGPIGNMPNLESLNVAHTDVESFAPLAGCQLKSLSCQGYPVHELRELVQVASLRDLWMNHIEDDRVYRVLERIPGIKRINGEEVNGAPAGDVKRARKDDRGRRRRW